MKHAEYERRIMSYIIDFVICFIFVTIEFTFFQLFQYILRFDLIMLMIMVNTMVYFSICYTVFIGYTIGSLIANVRIVNMDGTKMSVKVGLVRALLLGLVVLVVYNAIYMLVKRTQRSFYDECTNTTAVSIRSLE